MAVAEEVRQPAVRTAPSESIAHRLTHAPLNLFLLIIGILWLIPAAGLFVTSLLPPAVANATGWWHVFSKPSELTWSNYDSLLANDNFTGSIGTTVAITVPSTVLVVVLGSLAAYAFAWLDFPGRDWWFLLVVRCWWSPCRWP